MYRLHDHHRTEVRADVHIARARRGSTELLLNVGYDAVGLLDVVRGGELRRIELPTDDFSIYTWLVSPDGTRAYAFSGDGLDFAIEIDLVEESAAKLRVPDPEMLATELGWFEPALSVLDYQQRLWVREDDRLTLATKEQAAERLDPELRAFLDRYAVEKPGESDDEVHVRGRGSLGNSIGLFRWSTGEAFLAETDGTAIDWCHVEGALFVVYEKELVQIVGGRVTTMQRAEPDKLFVRVNAFIHEGQHYVALLSSDEDHDAPPSAYVTTFLATR